ncbi:MAG: ribonuclease domain-containing protein [Eubacteriales bacterium]|nr:ribonuclease domain-containing protein [Eubacteriales bacterium]
MSKRFLSCWLRLAALALALMLLPLFTLAEGTLQVSAADWPVTEDGSYSSMEEVAVYLAAYGHLPGNFIRKRDAESLGWNNRDGNLDAVAPGCSIGGDRFGNYEGALPDAKGRSWTECDIDFDGGYRNGKRIVFSSDGLIYYTSDHYGTFRQVEVAQGKSAAVAISKSGQYTGKEDVAAYLHEYGCLPSNYLTRSEAKALGWSSKKDNLGAVAPGCAIGGDSFGNREGLLPDAKGRKWYECDVDAADGRRSDKRLVYSSDGLIYYTADSHQTFERLY